MSETTRSSWDTVWRMGAIEFLNILSYRADKDTRERQLLEEWRRKH